jgi:hypothetical protein
MDNSAVDRVCREVVRSFPEMKGVRPTVRRQKGRQDAFQLTFKGKAKLPNGKTMKRVVRVTADDRGSVIRMSTSR